MKKSSHPPPRIKSCLAYSLSPQHIAASTVNVIVTPTTAPGLACPPMSSQCRRRADRTVLYAEYRVWSERVKSRRKSTTGRHSGLEAENHGRGSCLILVRLLKYNLRVPVGWVLRYCYTLLHSDLRLPYARPNGRIDRARSVCGAASRSHSCAAYRKSLREPGERLVPFLEK